MLRNARLASGLLLALLAIAAQLTLAAAVPASILSLSDVMAICQHDGGSNGSPSPADQAPAHHSPDCSLCFVCHAAAGPVGFVQASSRPPPPTMIFVARSAVLPPATAPPSRIALAARPRGPPTVL